MSELQSIDYEDFDEMIDEAEGLVLLDFWADWCGPCGSVAPALEELAPYYEGEVAFYKIDVDKNRELMQAFGVKSIPTVLLLSAREGGADVVGQVVGAAGILDYEYMIEQILNPPPSLFERIKGFFTGKGKEETPEDVDEEKNSVEDSEEPMAEAEETAFEGPVESEEREKVETAV